MDKLEFLRGKKLTKCHCGGDLIISASISSEGNFILNSDNINVDDIKVTSTPQISNIFGITCVKCAKEFIDDKDLAMRYGYDLSNGKFDIIDKCFDDKNYDNIAKTILSYIHPYELLKGVKILFGNILSIFPEIKDISELQRAFYRNIFINEALIQKDEHSLSRYLILTSRESELTNVQDFNTYSYLVSNIIMLDWIEKFNLADYIDSDVSNRFSDEFVPIIKQSIIDLCFDNTGHLKSDISFEDAMRAAIMLIDLEYITKSMLFYKPDNIRVTYTLDYNNQEINNNVWTIALINQNEWDIHENNENITIDTFDEAYTYESEEEYHIEHKLIEAALYIYNRFYNDLDLSYIHNDADYE